MSLQPLSHDLIVTLAAPTSALSGADGQIRATGVQGVFHADTRVLSQARLRLDGREPEPLGHAVLGADRARFVTVARWLGDPGVRIDRIRSVFPGRVEEVIEISSSVAVTTTVTIDVAPDSTPLATIRAGESGTGGAAGVTVTTSGDLSRTVEVGPGRPAVLRWELTVEDAGAVVFAPVRDARADFDRPMPYPSACRPQAWAAAAAISLLQSTLGLYPDVPNGVVTLRPLGPISVSGLKIAGRRVDVVAAADGTATIDGAPHPVQPRRPSSTGRRHS